MKKLNIIIMTIIILLLNTTIVLGYSCDKWALNSVKSLEQSSMLPNKLKNENLRTNITREEFTELYMLYFLSNYNYSGQPPKQFTDTSNKYIYIAGELGIVSGQKKNQFNPNTNIKRQEAATIAYRGESILGLDKISTKITPFKDNMVISPWARDAVNYMHATKSLSGDNTNHFNPTKNMTRQEAIVFISRLNNIRNEKDSKNYKKIQNDSYMSRADYEFIARKAPIKNFNQDIFRSNVFNTNANTRQQIYKQMINLRPSPKDGAYIFSPGAIFKNGNNYTVLYLEKRPMKDSYIQQRVVLDLVSLYSDKVSLLQNKQTGTWEIIKID